MSLPGAIERAPGLDRWLDINIDVSITVNTGKAEIGQGIMTAIVMIAAEELDVVVERIHVQTADTRITPNEQITAGSMSVEDSGSAVRVASAAEPVEIRGPWEQGGDEGREGSVQDVGGSTPEEEREPRAR